MKSRQWRSLALVSHRRLPLSDRAAETASRSGMVRIERGYKADKGGIKQIMKSGTLFRYGRLAAIKNILQQTLLLESVSKTHRRCFVLRFHSAPNVEITGAKLRAERVGSPHTVGQS